MLSQNRSEALARAYPGIPFRAHTRGWLARFMRAPAECAHLESDQSWMAFFAPDTLYIRGKARRLAQAGTHRPEVSLCRACLIEALRPELRGYRGRVVAFEPDPESVTQFFFIATTDFRDSGLRPETGEAIDERLAGIAGPCQNSACSRAAAWLWLSRAQVSSLDEAEQIRQAPGALLCAAHGTEEFCRSLSAIPQANLFYVNAPYGELGAYVWI